MPRREYVFTSVCLPICLLVTQRKKLMDFDEIFRIAWQLIQGTIDYIVGVIRITIK